MSARIDPLIAAAAMRAAGWEPLEPYSGAGAKWKCRCTGCGEIRTPRYSQLKRGTGCGVCAGNTPYSNERATEIMREHGFEPLAAYPSDANTPWPSRCLAMGHEVNPRFHSVNRLGRGCDHCARLASRIDADEAAALMRTSGWEPLVAYPGASKPWQARCLTCGTTRTPTYRAVKAGHGCGACSGAGPLDPDVAVARMLAGGARPLVPYVESSAKWESECLTCHRTVYPRLNQVTRGFGVCGHCAGNARLDDEVAAEVMRAAGLEPLVAYPGSSRKWECRCLGCGTVRSPTLNSIRSGKGGCARCAGTERLTHEAAAAVMLAAGFEPLDPYVVSGAPWRSRCTACGSVVSPSYSAIARGAGGCMSCRMSLSLPGRSAGMYVMTHEDLGAVKFGVGVVRGDLFPRVHQHGLRGWVEYARWAGFGDARIVLGVERLVLARWRGEGIAGFVPRSLMPQGGWSETAPVGAVNLDDLVGMVTALIGDVAGSLAEVSVGGVAA